VAPLELTESQPRADVIELHLKGELDLQTAYAFDRRMLDAEARQPKIICVDLGEVTMLDSAGLARLVSAHRRARKGKWRLVIIKGGRAVTRVLQVTRLEEHLEVVRDLDTALGPNGPRP
jgi:anti-anti-sigma factor